MAEGSFRSEDYLPKAKIGVLLPLPVVDVSPYEFYSIVRDRVMLCMVPGQVYEFTREDMERVLRTVDADIDRLVQRDVDIIAQYGVPLPVLIGVEAHDRLLKHIAERSGRPSTSNITGIVAGARHVGIKKIVTCNKWSAAMNNSLAEFFARGGITLAGVVSDVQPVAEFQNTRSRDAMELAYALGSRALKEYPEADGLYLGGGTWLSEPVSVALEAEFGKPVLTNNQAAVWDMLHLAGCWTPIEGHGALLASK